MTKPKTIAQKLVDCFEKIKQVKSNRRLFLFSRFNTLLMMHGKPSSDLFDSCVSHTTMPDGSVLTHTDDGVSAGGGKTMTDIKERLMEMIGALEKVEDQVHGLVLAVSEE